MLPRWSVGLFCNKSKNTCVDIQENISQKIAAIWTPHCGGKRDGCVLSAAKINLLFRNRVVFRRKCFGFSVRRNTLQKKLVDFSSKPLRFLAFSLSFLGKRERFCLRYAQHSSFLRITTRFRGHAPAYRVVFLWFMGEHKAPFNTSPVKENYSLPSHSTVCSSVLYPSRVKR